MISIISLIIGITLMYSSPLILAALGGVISEKSGVVNIGIEGMMTIGAFVGVTVSFFTQNPWLGFLSAGLAGGILALIHAFASITCKADQTISGLALNFIGPGLALFLCKIFFDGSTTTQSAPTLPKIFGSYRPESQSLQNLNLDITVIIAIILTFLMWFILYKTKWGLRIRAIGDHPSAADTLGINVALVRYICVFTSGILSGFAGASVTLAIISNFSPVSIAGQGFIALAAVIFGKWKPFGAYRACLIFGFAKAATVLLRQQNFQIISIIPSQFLEMLPYILTIVVLIIFVGNSSAPKASGKPYEKGAR